MNRHVTCSRRSNTRYGRAARRGMTLIEILISIGVLAIGLLGVAIMLTLAHHEAHEGVMEDGKAAAGMRAYREFRIRGMANPENWVGEVTEQDVNRVYQVRRAPYCLDPLGVAFTGSNVFPFPVPAGGRIPWMQRITLAPQPGGGTLGILRGNNVNAATLTPLQARLWADEVFRAKDDLNFELPEDETLPAQQQWLPNGYMLESGQQIPLPNVEAYAKRQAEGRFTWFATLVPDMNLSSDLYRLSIAVTNERDPTTDVRGDATLNLPGEQIATVTFLGTRIAQNNQFDVAFGGGDVQLESVSGAPIAHLVTGHWLLLGQLVENGQFDFRWYRIVATDAGDGLTTREVTLQGPDWQVRRGSATMAVLVPRVAAVYEKTIRLESSSLWSSIPML